ncbi:MAG: hypothetical protein ACFCVD_06540 [Nodosilinea sp.]
MELDVEEILNRFDRELASRNNQTLTAPQRTVLRWLLDCYLAERNVPSLRHIADGLGVTYGHVRDVASELYRHVALTLGRRAKKNTCARVVVEWYQQSVRFEGRRLLGRELDLQTLVRGVVEERRRVLCIFGPPGVGKTYLVGGLWEALKTPDRFQTAIWRQANEVPTVAALSHSVADELGIAVNPSAAPEMALTQVLRTRDCLLIIEKAETLYTPEDLAGRFTPASACYEWWLQALLDRHTLRGCVILVCRQPPGCLQRNHDNLLNHPLRGLGEAAAVGLLNQAGLSEHPPQDLQKLARFCGYNPGILQAAAYKIRQSASRNLDAFMQHPWAVDHADDDNWRVALQELTVNERELLGWLLLHPGERIGDASGRLTRNGQPDPILPAVMQHLQRRGLVEHVNGLYCLAMEWLRYVIARHLSETFAQALHDRDLQTLNRHPLIAPQASFGQRQWHWHQVLAPLETEWRKIDPDAWRSSYRAEVINAMLGRIREEESLQNGYAAGNLLNIAVALGVPPGALNATGLRINHADLSTTAVTGLNLADCHFTHTALPLPLQGALAAALSPTGRTLAVGDAAGRLLCWRREGGAYALYRFKAFRGDQGEPLPIQNVGFGNDETLAIVAGQQVYSWWIGDGEAPRWLMSVELCATSLACRCDRDSLSYVVVGLADGRITVWNDFLDEKMELGHRHAGEISELVPSPAAGSLRLMSKGTGDRVLVWDIGDTASSPEEIQVDDTIVISMTWQGDNPLLAFLEGRETRLRMEDGRVQTLPVEPPIRGLRFSADGTYLAAITSRPHKVVIKALANLSQSVKIPMVEAVNPMALANDGGWLLTQKSEPPQMLQIWDVAAQAIAWQVTVNPAIPPHALPQLRGCQGLKPVERDFWKSYEL